MTSKEINYVRKKLRICTVSNSSSEFGFSFSGLEQNMIFMTCISLTDMKKVSENSDSTIFPIDLNERAFILPLTAKEFAILGNPSIGAVFSVKISQLSEAI